MCVCVCVCVWKWKYIYGERETELGEGMLDALLAARTDDSNGALYMWDIRTRIWAWLRPSSSFNSEFDSRLSGGTESLESFAHDVEASYAFRLTRDIYLHTYIDIPPSPTPVRQVVRNRWRASRTTSRQAASSSCCWSRTRRGPWRRSPSIMYIQIKR